MTRRAQQQAKDVDPDRILAIVEELRWTNWPVSDSPRDGGRPRWVFIREVEERMPDVHPKVLMAKLRSMQRHGDLSGCMCGCRGDLELPDHDIVNDRDRMAG